MITELEIAQVVGKPEGLNLEYKAVLPPSKNIAQLISSFANSEGGYLILGVSDNLQVVGLSEDFHANAITHKALDMLMPQPRITYQYANYQNKKIYIIKVDKSETQILLEGKVYQRIGNTSQAQNIPATEFRSNGYARIQTINQQLNSYKSNATNAKIRFIEHYQSVLKLIDDLGLILYPMDVNTPTSNPEGKVLSRILYASFADNFETYLSDLLYEIFLANPSTLKSKQTVTIEEVLNCTDLQEFVKYWSKQKILKLQKGSVKGFINENKQISELNIIDVTKQNEIEKILQIRHLYSHRAGIIDEKFLQFFSASYSLNEEHQMSISEICDTLCYLADIVDQIDKAASMKYSLASSN
jgi:hypothetical protein